MRSTREADRHDHSISSRIPRSRIFANFRDCHTFYTFHTSYTSRKFSVNPAAVFVDCPAAAAAAAAVPAWCMLHADCPANPGPNRNRLTWAVNLGIDSSYVAKVPTWQAAALASSVSMAEERCAMSCPSCVAQTRAGFRRQRTHYKIQFCATHGGRPTYWCASTACSS